MKLLNKEFLLVKLQSSFRNFTVATLTWLSVTEYLCQKKSMIYSTCRKLFLVLSSFMTYYRDCNQIKVVQEQLTNQEHLSSPPVFERAVLRGLQFSVQCFVDLCLPFYSVSFGHCVVPLRFTDSDCSFGIFKLFFLLMNIS